MAWVAFADNARRHLEELQDERGADDYLLDRLREHIAEIAERPATLTEPAKLPYSPKRLMANFVLNDVTARRWGFTVTLLRAPDEEGIFILSINGAPLPTSLDD